MILVAAPVENNFADAGVARSLRNELADFFSAGHVAAGFHTGLFLCRAGRSDSAAGVIIDHLGVDMLDGPEDAQPRPLVRSAEFFPEAQMDALAQVVSGNLTYHFAPVLPTFFFSTSP